MLTNESRFISDGYYDETIQQQSRGHWIRINSYDPVTAPFKVQQTQLNLQDMLFNFADATLNVDTTVFDI